MAIAPNLTADVGRLAVTVSSTLDLTLQIYSYESVSTKMYRHLHILRSALIFIKRNSGLKIDFLVVKVVKVVLKYNYYLQMFPIT